MKQLGIVLLSRYANDGNNDINNKPMITTTDKFWLRSHCTG